MMYNINAENQYGWREIRKDCQRRAKRWVVKVGTSSLVQVDGALDQKKIATLLQQILAMKQGGLEVVMVLSGAVGVGASRLERPVGKLSERQRRVAASVGQSCIIQALLQALSRFSQLGDGKELELSQILLSRDDFSHRKRYRNAKMLLRDLLREDTIPVVNENDVIGSRLHNLGNNDRVAALIASMIDAQLLVLLTDQIGLYTGNPHQDAQAQLITEGIAEDPQLLKMATGSGKFGTGGMLTKLLAARMAAQCGTDTIIASSAERNILLRIAEGEPVGTFLYQKKRLVKTRLDERLDHLAQRMFGYPNAAQIAIGAV